MATDFGHFGIHIYLLGIYLECICFFGPVFLAMARITSIDVPTVKLKITSYRSIHKVILRQPPCFPELKTYLLPPSPEPSELLLGHPPTLPKSYFFSYFDFFLAVGSVGPGEKLNFNF